MQARLWPWLICLLLAGSALAQDSTAATQTRITFPLNRVFVTKAMGNGMDYARFNMNVAPGDQIHTKKLSRCELTLPGGSALRMDEKSDLIVGAPTEGQEPFLLNDGRLWVSMTPGDIRTFGILFGGSVYEFEGNGAAFRVERQADSLKVVLYRGYLAVGKKGGDSQLLTAGEKPMVAAPQIVNAAFVMQAPAEETAVEEGMADDSTAGDSTAMAVEMPETPAMPQMAESTAAAEMPETRPASRTPQLFIIEKNGTYTEGTLDIEKDAQSDWVDWNRRRDIYMGLKKP